MVSVLARTGPTRTSSVYGLIRSDILAGNFRPDEKLRIEVLRERYETGASPIREALNRLAAEGLVIQTDQRGFRVPPVSVEDLQDLTRARCLLNEILIREAIANATTEDEEALVLANFRLSRAPERTDDENHVAPHWAQLHADFHSALVVPSRSRWLLEFDRSLSEQAMRYLSLTAAKEFPRREVIDEHEAILNAFLAHDAPETTRLLNQHIMRTTEMVIEAETRKRRRAAA